MRTSLYKQLNFCYRVAHGKTPRVTGETFDNEHSPCVVLGLAREERMMEPTVLTFIARVGAALFAFYGRPTGLGR
jgi:hypothetical protein